ncbi:hypothetical protein L210DRAFT_3472398 [Boletus edulis BED1]|uniref:Uncharacterized protein n=1 Tax=Boletus edulis BED1 TaxID=1328754 RepID=A0AAD4GJ67_BOLED|nr:hypothetical protein L210DRAFT_3472398 [Boletus edulis BED1]
MSLHTPVSAVESTSSTLASSVSDLAFSPLTGPPPSSGQDSGFTFSLPDIVDLRLDKRDNSPDPPSDPHLMVVGDMLNNIAHTAQSASTACSLGQGLEANARIDELRKTIALVSELIAATQISDRPRSRRSSPRRFSAVSGLSIPLCTTAVASPSRPPSVTTMQDTQTTFNFSSEPSDLDSQIIPDTSDLSRKRCASSIPGDRVIKAMKIEPQDDSPHIMPQQGSFVLPNPEPISRPTSSAGLPQGVFNVFSTTQSVPGMAYSTPASSASVTSADFVSTSPLSTAIIHPTHFPPPVRTTWSDGTATIPPRTQQHPLPSSSFTTGISFQSIPSTNTGLSPLPFSSTGTFATASSLTRPVTVGGAGISPPIGRVSRSGSLTSSNPFAFGLPEVPPVTEALDFLQPSLPAAKLAAHSPASSQEGENDFDSDGGDVSHSQSPESASGNNPRISAQSQVSRPVAIHDNRSSALLTQKSMENLSTSNHSNEVPQEYRAEVDRIFFEFLKAICSNLEATDTKGELIHQTLMAKKMQRLDESPDFRPFKFRIQAFTNAFLEELARQGYPEDKIPMKKIRTYLWNQPYISRFNEEGKKTKSKGNHIWNIDAKKHQDGSWTFRPFHRRLAGSPPSVAYAGLRWSWAPRIWDPQASRANLQVTFSSPSLPSWLSWEDDVLQGTPPPDAENCEITVMARYIQDGVEEQLIQTFHLSIAPVSTLDGSIPAPRRSSMNGDLHKARRISSDMSLPQLTPTRPMRSATISSIPPPVASHDAQVIQVLTTAAQRVAQEAQSQVIASTVSNEHAPELQALAKQQYVLTVTAQAFDQEVSGQRFDTPQTNVLAVAAQQVVLQAARQVAADRSAAVATQISAGLPPPPSAATQVTVNEVSVATQSAVAQAVEITGPLSSEVDVLMTASSLLQQQTRAPVSPISVLDPTQRIVDVVRSRSMRIVSAASFPASSLTSSAVPVVPFTPDILLPELQSNSVTRTW